MGRPGVCLLNAAVWNRKATKSKGTMGIPSAPKMMFYSPLETFILVVH